MAADQFSLAIELTRGAAPIEMLRDLASHTLVFAGCQADDASTVVAGAEAAIEQAFSADGLCRLRIDRNGDDVTIAVSSRAGEIWQSTRSVS